MRWVRFTTIPSLMPAVEPQEFVGLGVAQSVDAGHTIADGQHGAHLVEFLLIGKALELVK